MMGEGQYQNVLATAPHSAASLPAKHETSRFYVNMIIILVTFGYGYMKIKRELPKVSLLPNSATLQNGLEKTITGHHYYVLVL